MKFVYFSDENEFCQNPTPKVRVGLINEIFKIIWILNVYDLKSRFQFCTTLLKPISDFLSHVYWHFFPLLISITRDTEIPAKKLLVKKWYKIWINYYSLSHLITVFHAPLKVWVK